MKYSLNYHYFFWFLYIFTTKLFLHTKKKKKKDCNNNIHKLINFVQCDILKMYILHSFWLNILNINNT